MAANNILGIIFSNAYDEVIPELTSLRTMGSVPFGGRYRLIDFPLSNMVNSGITKVGIITNSNYRSLMDHIGNGKPWDLSRRREGLTLLPPFSKPDTGIYSGKAEALYGSIDYISDSNKDYVLFTDCNIISCIDFEEMSKFNIAKNADITVAYTSGVPASINKATEYVLDGNGRINEVKYINDFSKETNYSIKTMIIRRNLLERLLHDANSKQIFDLEQILANNAQRLNIYGYKVNGYVKVIGSITDYYDASLDLLDISTRKALFNTDKPVYTKSRGQEPAFYGINASVSGSLIADGCKIEGEVENSILFRGVTVAKGAKIKNCVIMQDTFIGENSNLECVIADKKVVIKPNKKLCGAENYPVYIGKKIVI